MAKIPCALNMVIKNRSLGLRLEMVRESGSLESGTRNNRDLAGPKQCSGSHVLRNTAAARSKCTIEGALCPAKLITGAHFMMPFELGKRPG